MPQKDLQKIYEIVKRDVNPFAQSSYGVIYEVKKIGCSDDEPSYALKTIQTRNDVDKRKELSTIIIEENRFSIRTEIDILTSIKNKLGDLKANHIIPILDYGLWPVKDTAMGEPCFVMPYGESSLDTLKGNEDIVVDIHLWFQYAEQLLTALNAISTIEGEEDLQSHRDIKPDNIVLVDGELYLIDFGIARAKKAGRTTRRFGGTIEWMAPEQAIPNRFECNPEDGKMCPCYHMGPSVDIYSTGHVLYWICTKEPLASQNRIESIFNKGKPSPASVESFEKIGGISEAELSCFAQTLLQHHTASQANTGKTFRPHAPDYALPNMKIIVESMASLLQSMLAVKEDDRIIAPAAFQAVKAIQKRLKPKLESITIDAPSQVFIKQIYTLTVTIKGQGLEKDNSWWQLSINDAEVHGTYQAKQEADAWTWTISRQANDIEETLTVRVRAFIGVDCESKEHKISVLISPEGLWELKRYVEALAIYPEKEEWLANIREQIKNGPDDRKTWLGIMDSAYKKLQSLDMVSTCVGFMALRTSLQKQVEEDKQPKIYEPKAPKPPKSEEPRNPEPEGKEKPKSEEPKSPESKKPTQPVKEEEKHGKTRFIFFLAVIAIVFLPSVFQKIHNQTINNNVITSVNTEFQMPKTYSLIVNTTPSYAQVRLVGAGQPDYYDGIALPKGNYKVEVSASGYDTITKWVYITDNNVVEQITLKKTVTISDIVAQADEYRRAENYAKAFPLYQQAADAGNADGQFWLARFYEKGYGVTQNYTKAAEWYTRAANRGDAYAQYNLGELYYYGRGVSKDYTKAAELYTLAAKQGNANAQYSLGWLYENGLGVTKDINKAIEYYEAAAKKDHSYAKGRLEELQKPKTYGLTVKTTPSNARVRVMKIEPIYHDGIQLENGKTYTIKVDAEGYQTVTKYYTINGKDIVDHVTLKAKVEKKVETIDDVLARAHTYNVAKEYAKAFPLYKQAADAGNADGQFWLARFYEQGQGVSRNYTKAVEWYTRAAYQGHAGAQNNLGALYESGQGVIKSYSTAITWYTAAANQGDDSAQWNLGLCYYEGKGVSKNKAYAIELFKKAAKQGQINAQNELKELGETW